MKGFFKDRGVMFGIEGVTLSRRHQCLLLCVFDFSLDSHAVYNGFWNRKDLLSV